MRTSILELNQQRHDPIFYFKNMKHKKLIEMDLGRLAPVSEVTGGHTLQF
jgi:hypothetical protein